MSNQDRAEGKKDQAVGSVKETVVRADWLTFSLLFALFFLFFVLWLYLF